MSFKDLVPEFLAHTPNCKGEWHDLSSHLFSTANLAKEFCKPFGAGNIAFLNGLLHDIAKIYPTFKSYLIKCAEAEEKNFPPPVSSFYHALPGAIVAATLLGNTDVAFSCMLIAGHHTGLRSASYVRSEIRKYMKDKASMEVVNHIRSKISDCLGDISPYLSASIPDRIRSDHDVELFWRMVFSSLIDADRLDTEKHFRPKQSKVRNASKYDLANLYERLLDYIEGLSSNEESTNLSGKALKVQRVREEVLENCIRSADKPCGVFRLTEPTGSGKTLSGLAFALRHAVRNKLDRVIVAVPYTSIIDQTAEVFKKALGNEAVLEHHSGFVFDDERPETLLHRLAIENWDAPVIVTTTVQLFESLFSNVPSKVRKIHRVSNSVIIIDEAQSIPYDVLDPTLDVIRSLTEHYNTSIVFCTATQPASDDVTPFKRLSPIDIVPDYRHHFSVLKRVRYTYHGQWTWDQLTQKAIENKNVLVTVNKKDNAYKLVHRMLQLSGPSGLFHLSTYLCPMHRKNVIQKVRSFLKEGVPCRLVTTPIIEAGVNIDFIPIGLREMGPLDSIIQFAGRVNREGTMDGLGHVGVFELQDETYPTYSQTAIDETRNILKGGLDPHDPETVSLYFRKVLQLASLDRYGVQKYRSFLDYPEVAKRYRLIDDQTQSVIVSYRDLDKPLIQRIKNGDIDRDLMREIQILSVPLYESHFTIAMQRGLIKEVGTGFWQWVGEYDELTGIGKALLS